MKNFSHLFLQLDQTTKTSLKIEAIVHYFEKVEDHDRMWAIAILSQRRQKRTVKTSLLRQWAAEAAAIPLWLLEESYHVVGDLAETIALILPVTKKKSDKSLSGWIDFLSKLNGQDEEIKKEEITNAWASMAYAERFVFNKLITGGFRMGVSQKLIIRALAKFEGQEENIIAHRLMGNWNPDKITYTELIRSTNALDDISKPYPFYLAYALENDLLSLGDISDWQIERKWDGIRGQIIVRDKNLFIWSRGEELITDKFPELHTIVSDIPNGTVIDGEILPFRDGNPLTFNVLQTRIGRKNVTKKIMESAPVILMAYDLLEREGKDLRSRPLQERRALLVKLLKENHNGEVIHLSQVLPLNTWKLVGEEREKSRMHMSEGLMLKRLDSTYKSGRIKGDWWKWKVDPLTIDAVMIYAQPGHGRRANLFTDYTFAVWDKEALVPFAKAYSGLTDEEFRKITSWTRRNTVDRFGPVRSVRPELVFELAFEGINASKRHKSGIALRFPRILRWRNDKKAKDANSLKDLKKLLELYG